MKKVAIIGAGLSGLMSAWYIKQFNPDAQVTIFEADKKGGQISTEEHQGVLLEKGPAFLLLENPVLQHALSKINSENLLLCKDEKAYVLKDTYYQKAPSGFMEYENGIFSFLSSGMSSIFAMKKKVSLWDTLSFFDFLKSTYGMTYAENQGSSFARNIFYTEAENLNFRSAYSELYDELKKGLGLKETLQKFNSEKKTYWQKESLTSFTPGIYYYKGGLSKIFDDLSEDLKSKDCHIEFAKIHDISHHKNEFTLHSRKSKFGPFDKVISTINAHEQSALLKGLHKELSIKLAELKYRPVSYVYSAYNFKDFNRAGLGFFAPRKEKLTISGTFYINSINKEIEKLNQFVTRTIIPGDLSLFSDQELIDIQNVDFEKVYSLTAKPLWSKVFRNESQGPLLDNHYTTWKNSVRQIEKEISNDIQGLGIIGNDMSGSNISRILEEAYQTAKNV
ncbi:MAG: protoporphyrinogen oxidase [Spirochaetia bacterium]|nr:protoporphyrinogen oxidase [Spirochaetia bacterium]